MCISIFVVIRWTGPFLFLFLFIFLNSDYFQGNVSMCAYSKEWAYLVWFTPTLPSQPILRYETFVYLSLFLTGVKIGHFAQRVIRILLCFWIILISWSKVRFSILLKRKIIKWSEWDSCFMSSSANHFNYDPHQPVPKTLEVRVLLLDQTFITFTPSLFMSLFFFFPS